MVARMSITNLRTGRSVSPQFQPEEHKLKLAAAYNELEILGASYQPHQYKSTSNMELALKLTFDAMSSRDVPGTTVQGVRGFLMSLLLKPTAGEGVLGGGPPDLLFVWPKLATLFCRLHEYEETGRRYAKDGTLTLFDVQLKLKAIREFNLYAEDVEANGTLLD